LGGLGLSISLDELAIDFSLGLGAHRGATVTQIVAVIVVIVTQTLVLSPLGLSLGTRICLGLRGRIDRLTNPALVVLGGTARPWPGRLRPRCRPRPPRLPGRCGGS
jgi:putative Mn2+ efflux pump MntP